MEPRNFVMHMWGTGDRPGVVSATQLECQVCGLKTTVFDEMRTPTKCLVDTPTKLALREKLVARLKELLGFDAAPVDE